MISTGKLELIGLVDPVDMYWKMGIIGE